MNISIKIIDVDYIKSNTVVQDLVKDKNLDSFIYSTQDSWIQPILGTTLYDSVISAITANSGSTSGLTSSTMQTLVDNIKPTLAYYTIYEALPYLAIKIANNGIIRRTGGDFQAVDIQELTFLRKDILEKAKSKETILRAFLETNKTTYYDNITTIEVKRNFGGFYF